MYFSRYCKDYYIWSYCLGQRLNAASLWHFRTEVPAAAGDRVVTLEIFSAKRRTSGSSQSSAQLRGPPEMVALAPVRSAGFLNSQCSWPTICTGSGTVSYPFSTALFLSIQGALLGNKMSYPTHSTAYGSLPASPRVLSPVTSRYVISGLPHSSLPIRTPQVPILLEPSTAMV